MTTLAIVGSGIAGRSLLYSLALEKKSFEKIAFFSSDTFLPPCTPHSTAVVASRGITRGHSALGDLLCDGLEVFKDHVNTAFPSGVEEGRQLTGATKNLEIFKARYPGGKISGEFFKEKIYVAEEKAYIIDPENYTFWLLTKAAEFYQDKLEIIQDLVIQVEQTKHVRLKTHTGQSYLFDKVIFAGGASNRFWKKMISDDVTLNSSKPVPGSYLEFNNISWEGPSVSITFNGNNLIWNRSLQKLLIGSSSHVGQELLPRHAELKNIYQELESSLKMTLPSFSLGKVKTGLREKAKKRQPYLVRNKNMIFFGGLYKNGFILSLKMAKDLVLSL